MKEVKELRLICGIKQFQLAEKLGIEQSNYANMENGRLIPKNIAQLQGKAFKILKPYLQDRISDAEIALNELNKIKNIFYEK